MQDNKMKESHSLFWLNLPTLDAWYRSAWLCQVWRQITESAVLTQEEISEESGLKKNLSM